MNRKKSWTDITKKGKIVIYDRKKEKLKNHKKIKIFYNYSDQMSLKIMINFIKKPFSQLNEKFHSLGEKPFIWIHIKNTARRKNLGLQF